LSKRGILVFEANEAALRVGEELVLRDEGVRL
jgi:hypothetical protein